MNLSEIKFKFIHPAAKVEFDKNNQVYNIYSCSNYTIMPACYCLIYTGLIPVMPDISDDIGNFKITCPFGLTSKDGIGIINYELKKDSEILILFYNFHAFDPPRDSFDLIFGQKNKKLIKEGELIGLLSL